MTDKAREQGEAPGPAPSPRVSVDYDAKCGFVWVWDAQQSVRLGEHVRAKDARDLCELLRRHGCQVDYKEFR